jgi:hypothetical protein
LVDPVGPLCFTWNKDGRFGRSWPRHWTRLPLSVRELPRFGLEAVDEPLRFVCGRASDGPRTAEDAFEDGLEAATAQPPRAANGRQGLRTAPAAATRLDLLVHAQRVRWPPHPAEACRIAPDVAAAGSGPPLVARGVARAQRHARM